MSVLSLRAAIPAATAVHNHLDPRFGIAERGNHTFAGRCLTVAGWRAVAHRFTVSDFGLDARRRTALVAAMRHLDAALDRPIRIIHVTGWREVEVLGAVSYLTKLSDRTLSAMFTDRFGMKRRVQAEMTLFPALYGTWWIAQMLDALGLDWRDSPAVRLDAACPEAEQLFCTAGSCVACRGPEAAGAQSMMEQRLVGCLHRMLRADARFRALRLQVAEHVVGADVLAMALRAQVPSNERRLTLAQAQAVWRHWNAYCEVGRHAPSLLALLTLYFQDGGTVGQPEKVLHELKRAVLSGGSGWGRIMQDRAWAYLLKAGMRSFAEPLRHAGSSADLDVVRRTLRAIAEAEFPDPPTPLLWRAWITLNGDASRGFGFDRWCRLPVSVRRVTLFAAEDERHKPDYAAWVARALDVFWSATDPKLGKLKLRRGTNWTKLEALAQARREEAAAYLALEWQRWDSLVEACTIDGLQAVPLTTGVQLFDESRAMGHCAADMVDFSRLGLMRIFSLRRDGRRVATVALQCHPDNGWLVYQVRRRFNALPHDQERAVGLELAARYEEAALIADRLAWSTDFFQENA